MGSHDSSVAAANGAESITENGATGAFAQLSPLSVPFEWPSTLANPAAQCRCEATLHVPFCLIGASTTTVQS